MPSSNPLIAVGISAVVAIGLIKTAPAQAEPSARYRSTHSTETNNASPPDSQSELTVHTDQSKNEAGTDRSGANAAAHAVATGQSSDSVLNQPNPLAQSGRDRATALTAPHAASVASQPEAKQPADAPHASPERLAANEHRSNADAEAHQAAGEAGTATGTANTATATATPTADEPKPQPVAPRRRGERVLQRSQPSHHTDSSQSNPVELGQQPQSGSSDQMSTPAQSGDSLQQELNQVEQQEQQDQQEVQQDVDQGNPSPSGRDSTPSSPREQPNSGSSRRARNSATFEPPPDYLNPSPNPLNFPTKPEEVDIVGTQPITLRQAVDLAIRNNPELQQARLDLESAKAQLRQAEAAYYPSLDATASLLHQESQSIGSPVLLDQNNPAGGSRVPVVAENSTALRGTVSLTYNIYTSGQRPATVKAAEGTVQFRQLDVERQTEDLILNTITDYYDLQQAAENVRINQSTVTASQQSLRDSQALERAGVGTRFDVLQAEVRLANDQQQLVQSLSNLEIARRRLVQRLNLAQSVNIATADPVQPAGVWDLSLPDTIVQAYKNRAELEEQLVQRDIAQQRRRAALAQLGPQLTAQAQTSANSTDLFADNPNNQQDLAFFYSYQAALGVSINLFDGGAAQAQARQQEINIASAESQFNNLQNQIRFQVEQAYYQLQSNFTNIQTTALAVQQAQEALRLARLRFQAGVGTQTDVLNQQTELTRAEVNRLNAVLDYNRALATLQRSVSNFPEGYLSDVP